MIKGVLLAKNSSRAILINFFKHKTCTTQKVHIKPIWYYIWQGCRGLDLAWILEKRKRRQRRHAADVADTVAALAVAALGGMVSGGCLWVFVIQVC